MAERKTGGVTRPFRYVCLPLAGDEEERDGSGAGMRADACADGVDVDQHIGILFMDDGGDILRVLFRVAMSDDIRCPLRTRPRFSPCGQTGSGGLLSALHLFDSDEIPSLSYVHDGFY